MAKPRRRHPDIDSAMASPQGRDFIELCVSVVGQEVVAYAPLEGYADGTHLYVWPGPTGLGLLVERPRREDGEEWVREFGFLTERPEDGVSVVIELVSHRWDPRLAAKATGKEDALKASPKKRRAITQERSAESGRSRDRLTLRVLPLAQSPKTVAGVERSTIDKALGKHELVLGTPTEAVESSPPDTGETAGQNNGRALPAPATAPRPSKDRRRPAGDIYLGPAFPVPEPIHTPSTTYLGKEHTAGPKATQYLTFLQQEGFRAGFDEEGDVWFEFDGGHYYLLSEEDDPAYFRLLFPNFWPIADESGRQLAHEVVSRVNQEIKGVKLVVTDDQVTAELELFLVPLDSFTRVFPRCLVAVRSAVERFREIVTPE